MPPGRVTIDLTREINTESGDTASNRIGAEFPSRCGGTDKIAPAWNGLDEQIKDDNGAAWVLQVCSLPIKYPMQKSGRRYRARDFTAHDVTLIYIYIYAYVYKHIYTYAHSGRAGIRAANNITVLLLLQRRRAVALTLASSRGKVGVFRIKRARRAAFSGRDIDEEAGDDDAWTKNARRVRLVD